MWDFLLHLFDTSGFPPRWHCGNWTSGHGWLHIVSDLGVWSAYVAIPCVLAFFAYRKRDLPFRTIFWLFGAFILACGSTHLMEAIIFWWPAYRLAGVIKLLTALVSWGTVLALIPTTPQALALRGPGELEREVTQRRQIERELLGMRAELERRVEERTAELTQANAALQAEIAVRQRVEEALESAREWFEVTLASIADAVIVTDTVGRLTFINRAARNLTAWQHDVQGQPLDDVFRIVREDTGQPAEDPVEKVLATGRNEGLAEHRILIAADGDRHPIDVSAATIRNDQANILGVVLVFRDVTERKRAEQALREADRRKDEFLAMLGHELRNPLAGIAGAVQVLDVVGSANSDTEEMRGIIRRQSEHMCRLIDDLLEVSRISRGKLQLRPERLDLVELVSRTADDFRSGLLNGGVSLRWIAPGESLWVDGDPTRLAQVTVNLLHNAVKFTNAGGEVTVSVGCDDNGRLALLTVRDNGIGMAPQTLASVFDPFSQAEGSSARGGLGLGLALVRGLVELHGGAVAASSPGLGCGSEFTVRLPLVAPPEPAPADDGQQGEVQATYRVLIIDDSRDASYPLQTLLAHLGHDVQSAVDGPKGVALAKAFHPQIVLCDIGLPGGMDGYAVAQALRADEVTRDVYLVAVTGYGQEEDRRRAAEAGFDRHLTKPVGIGTLKALLSSGLSRGPMGR